MTPLRATTLSELPRRCLAVGAARPSRRLDLSLRDSGKIFVRNPGGHFLAARELPSNFAHMPGTSYRTVTLVQSERDRLPDRAIARGCPQYRVASLIACHSRLRLRGNQLVPRGIRIRLVVGEGRNLTGRDQVLVSLLVRRRLRRLRLRGGNHDGLGGVAQRQIAAVDAHQQLSASIVFPVREEPAPGKINPTQYGCYTTGRCFGPNPVMIFGPSTATPILSFPTSRDT